MGKYCKDVVLFHKVNSCNMSKFIYRESSPIDEFHFRKGISSDDGKDVTFVIDPIYESFNMERLQHIGRYNVENWLESLKQSPLSPLHELRSKCSDEQLVSMMKSRYCQSPSDVLAWSQHLSLNVDAFNSELARVKSDQAKQTTVDNTKAD